MNGLAALRREEATPADSEAGVPGVEAVALAGAEEVEEDVRRVVLGLGALDAHLVAECSIPFDHGVLDRAGVRAVRCEMAGRVTIPAVGPAGCVGRFRVRQMEL